MVQMTILPLVWIVGFATSHTSPLPCCLQKTVGGVSYTLDQKADTSAYNCLENCVYQSDGNPGPLFCFAAGDLEVVCDGVVTDIPGGGKPCCDVLDVEGRHFPKGKYTKTKDKHYNKPVYKHEDGEFCIFFARHWKVDGCDFIRPGGDWSQGMGWSKKEPECPGDIGNYWRYYSWGEEGSDSGPVEQDIEINCEQEEEEKGDSCNRDCTKDPKETKTCRFTFVLKQLLSDKPGRLADGMIRPVLVYNGKLAGPTIAVCEGDRVVVKLVNRLHGSPAQIGGYNSTTLHFHGIREKQPNGTSDWSHHGGPWSDGVPLVTQCPTPSGDNQTYIFSDINGAPAGTYWYHSHMGRQRMNGAEGKLIIMQIKKDTRVDVDLPENSLFLQEWYPNTKNNIPQSLLINGKGKRGKHCYKQSDASQNYDEFISNFKMGKQVSFTKYLCPSPDISTTYEVFNVKKPGQKYRFRIIGGIGDDVPIRISIEDHQFSVIATDARDVMSADNFDALWVSAGERYDIVINTNKSFKQEAYKINVYHKHGDILLCTLAWLKYSDTSSSQKVPSDYEANCRAMDKLFLPRVLNPVPNKFSDWDNPNYIYPVNLTAMDKVQNIKEVLNTQYITIPVHEKGEGFMFNYVTMPFPKDYPDIPFLFQSPSKTTKRCGVRCVWDSTGSPRSTNCSQFPACPNYPNEKCQCQHVIQQPWYDGSDGPYWFEIILINNQAEGGIAHPIHHHGGWFNILGMDQFNHTITRDTIMKMDKNCGKKKECLPRKYTSPVFKDVIQVPTNGYVIFRAPIDNRGTWIVHCHINYHIENGMAMIFQIGEPGGWSMGPDKKTARKNKNKKCPKVQPQMFG